MLRLPPSPARRAVPLLLLGALAACSAALPPEEPQDPSEAADALSISNLYRVATGTVDRSKVDPANPWAQTTLGVGEEHRLPDEDGEFAAIAKLVNRFQDHSKKESGAKKLERAFHAKSHACVLGSLAIDPAELPAAARVGLFADAATYPTWARFSNGVGQRQSDRKLDLRGFALKIMGVKGPRIVTTPGDETATTQDFLMGNHDVAPASDARHMMAFGEAMMGSADSTTILGKVDNLLQAGGFLTSNENVRIVDFLANHALDKTKKVGSLLGDTFSTGATNALGLEAGDPLKARAKGAFKLVVKTGVLQGTRCAPIEQAPSKADDFLRTDLEKRFAAGAVCADVFVQIQTDPKAEPIEDVSVPWRTKLTKVGRLTLERRDLASPAVEAERARCDGFSFRPWHTIEAHRPLGNVMRARRVALPSSAGHRDADMREPTP